VITIEMQCNRIHVRVCIALQSNRTESNRIGSIQLMGFANANNDSAKITLAQTTSRVSHRVHVCRSAEQIERYVLDTLVLASRYILEEVVDRCEALDIGIALVQDIELANEQRYRITNAQRFEIVVNSVLQRLRDRIEMHRSKAQCQPSSIPMTQLIGACACVCVCVCACVCVCV
jgi:hypothetical protein